MLFDQAVQWLISKEIIEVIPGDFGPAIIMGAPNYPKRLMDLEKDRSLPFRAYSNLILAGTWLEENLEGVNKKFAELNVTEQDFNNPDADWAPLPLDRESPALKQVVVKVEETIEHLRGDNGYEATLPGEKASVTSNLRVFIQHVQNAPFVTLPFVRDGVLAGLSILRRRFVETALGAIAAAAWVAVVEWLKEYGIHIGKQ